MPNSQLRLTEIGFPPLVACNLIEPINMHPPLIITRQAVQSAQIFSMIAEILQLHFLLWQVICKKKANITN